MPEWGMPAIADPLNDSRALRLRDIKAAPIVTLLDALEHVEALRQGYPGKRTPAYLKLSRRRLRQEIIWRYRIKGVPSA